MGGRRASRDVDEATPLLRATKSEKGSSNPGDHADAISLVTFSWLGALLSKGAHAPLQKEDLWELQATEDTEHVTSNLRDALAKVKPRDPTKKLALGLAIRKAFGTNMYLAGVCKLFGDLLGFVAPICINEIIKYVEDSSNAWFYPQYFGWIMSGALFLSTVLQTLFLHQHHHLVIREAIRVRSALTMLVYEKSLRLSLDAKSTLGSGKIMNLGTTDTNRILDLFYFVHYVWAAPLQLVLGLMLLLKYLGVAALAGVGIMVLLLPLSASFSSHAAQISKFLLECTDKRLKCVSELFQSIRIIKLYAWETAMLARIDHIRTHELAFLKKMIVWNALSQVALQAGPILVALCSFATFSWLSPVPLTPDRAFTSIALFSIFRLPLMMLPRIFSLIFQANVSINRLEEFLETPELTNAQSSDDQLPPQFLGIRNATFAWGQGSKPEQGPSVLLPALASQSLSHVSVTLPKGQLTLIVGGVGSGKSTLLAALLGELTPESGEVSTPRSNISYAAQSPYLVNATIEDNIVFGAPYNSERLKRVVQCCELEADLKQFPNGLKSEVGESGVNLSGGQKQRISIARAVYGQRKDFYVFDDSLSALDATVAARVFNQCLNEGTKSLLAGKTRVLATHSLKVAKSAQWIIVMDKMRVVQMGTFDELMKNHGGLFAEMMRSVATTTGSATADAPAQPGAVATTTSHSEQAIDTKSRLVEDEARAVGHVSLSVYFSYLKSCGIAWSVCALALLFATQISTVSTDLWLTHWTGMGAEASTGLVFYLSVYAYLGLATVLLGFVGDVSCRFGGLRASTEIHHQLLHHVTKGTMRFFDSTPVGRILNRFSNDMSTIDQKLNSASVAFVTMSLSLLSMLVIQCVSAPLLMACFVPLFVGYMMVQNFYRQSSRELQRLDNISKSPIYAHFTQTLNGLVTIRAFQMQTKSHHDQAQRINDNTKAFLLLNLINRWLGVRLESLGALITLAVALFVCKDRAELSSALAGLLLSYSQSMNQLLNWIVRNNIDMENMMNSVERTDEYTKIETECKNEDDVSRSLSAMMLQQRPKWPENGAITFSNVSIHYKPGAPLVLNDVSFTIEGGEKVGICGRTGAGKSTMLLSLFRMIECSRGSIEIDGINIARLTLSQLRSRMAIIPQDPVLFGASIRYNLDPTNEHSDTKLWEALRKAHLHHMVSEMPEKLDADVKEGGENLSVGERQLFCLARAILRNSQILCLDEATASMDHKSDELIQASLRHDFALATVLTIAHRLETILDYDKIMVLQRGEIVEFDTPSKLASKQQPLGEFAAMLQASRTSQSQ
ncbi:TPA: hypothetical protein N0F65_006875 [Lagenidium giganteum]|uniref:Uncharacterized protein n=1 Tax=Lagenidium giganteum TaxID=4803 RepID=A0AAV2ZBS5_9STRA|nr:TPA: hypothetical protein N0F65_006875 [Lagenidium giganteum]